MQRYAAIGLTSILLSVALCCAPGITIRSGGDSPRPEFYEQAERITRHKVHEWVNTHMDGSIAWHIRVAAMRMPTVYFVNNVCPNKNIRVPVIVHKGVCYGGLTFTWDRIYVAVSDSRRVGPTSFVHEMAHAWRKVLYNDYDGDHSETEWWNYFVGEIRATVMVAEMAYFR